MKYICKVKRKSMSSLTLNIPDTLNLDDKEIKILLASGLYERGKITLGQGAELAGVTKRTFMEMLGKYNVSVFNFPPAEISSDAKNT
jgi:predicted HTH domain antitoxin